MEAFARPPPKTPSHLKGAVDPVFSSSPAFATPALPIKPAAIDTTSAFPHQRRPSTPQSGTFSPRLASPGPRTAPVLPILLPPATLRPIAFRTFTKKHNLTLTTPALQALAKFIGKHCGSGWREEGLAEGVLEEVARAWKKADGKVIVDAEDGLKMILKQLEGSMLGGRVVTNKTNGTLSRQSSGIGGPLESLISGERPAAQRNESQDSLGMSSLDVGVDDDMDDDENALRDVRGWLKVIGAFEQPRMIFNPSRKHFERLNPPKGLLSNPSEKTDLFRQRYHLIHQRLLRNESFQLPTAATHPSAHLSQDQWKLTSIANLLGRSGSGHLLLGLLIVTPTGTLALADLTGTVALDLEQATPIEPDLETWLCPGMIVLVDGVYEESYANGGGSLAGEGGVGGTIGGKFIAFSVGPPKTEPRAVSLGLSEDTADSGVVAGGFGWVDFLGVGSERAIGASMRRLEQRLLSGAESQADSLPSDLGALSSGTKMVLLGHCALDQPKTLTALRTVFAHYNAASDSLTDFPISFVLFGPFTSHAALSSPSSANGDNATSSMVYKEYFDSLAGLLTDFPLLLRQCTFIFVPGDYDPWASAFSAGAACPLPRKAIPEMFTSRVRRAFAAANSSSSNTINAAAGATNNETDRVPGTAIWATNPARVSLFGPSQELVLFRDDITGRLRRNSIALKKQEVEHMDVDHEPAGDADSGIAMSGALPSTAAIPDAQPVDIESQPLSDRNVESDKTVALDATMRHARRLTKTLLDQSHLSPFPLSIRPQHWAHAHSLSLYPLPTSLVLCDSECSSFALVYQGCCVINAGRLVERDGRRARWCEYDARTRRGTVQEALL